LTLHEEMFGDVWTWAGMVRKTNLNLGLSVNVVDQALFDLAQDVNYRRDQTDMDWLEQATLLHHRAVQIHPFLNGNGRWSRMLTNIWLRLNAQPMILWPDTTIASTSPIRSAYIAALRQADGGDFSALRRLHEQHLESK
jgi:fido (protein-threonine AMPylation protein)